MIPVLGVGVGTVAAAFPSRLRTVSLPKTNPFAKNLLLNVNSILKSDFDLRQWQHVALFNTVESRIEMHLEASCKLAVEWPGHHRQFAKGERLLTEYSYKYTLASMTTLLRRAGFKEVRYWTDPKAWFAVFWATT